MTGANSGIGFEAAAVLARRGANTVLACRDTGKAEAAAAKMTAAAPGATVSVVRMDLASLGSVRAAAAEILAGHGRLDLLINNAGVMWPAYGKTADGFELQFGTNHLGHFALTGLLLEALLPVPGSRVVTVSSNGHRAGRIDFADLQSERHYGRMAAYGQSKLANLMFTYELQRRLGAAGAPTAAPAAHPGAAFTDLTRYLPGVLRAVYPAVGGLFTQGAAMARCPPCARPPTRPPRAGSTTGPAAWPRSRATRCGCPPTPARARRAPSAGFGPSRSASPASPTRSDRARRPRTG